MHLATLFKQPPRQHHGDGSQVHVRAPEIAAAVLTVMHNDSCSDADGEP